MDEDDDDQYEETRHPDQPRRKKYDPDDYLDRRVHNKPGFRQRIASSHLSELLAHGDLRGLEYKYLGNGVHELYKKEGPKTPGQEASQRIIDRIMNRGDKKTYG